MSCGTGLREGTKNWPQLMAEELGADYVNLARTGWGNQWIFRDTVEELSRNQYDLVIVQWSAIGRVNLNIGFEAYQTTSRLTPDTDYNLVNHRTVRGAWLYDNILKNVEKVRNPFWDILDVGRYAGTIKRLHGNVWFVNGLCDWPAGFFTRHHDAKPDSLGAYTREILQVTERDDDEIDRLYNFMHDQFSQSEGFSDNWINLYHSLHAMKVDDAAPDDLHPGPASQKLFAKLILAEISKLPVRA